MPQYQTDPEESIPDPDDESEPEETPAERVARTARHPRFEVVIRDAEDSNDVYYMSRFRASNGRIVWTTETYTRKEAAHEAIRLLKQAARSYVDPLVAIRVVTLDERHEDLQEHDAEHLSH